MPLLIYDLDGTLIDSRRDLANSVNATLAFMSLPALSDEVIFSYVGHGAAVLIGKVLGGTFSEEEVARALAFFLSYYAEHKLDYTELYPGVRESLDRLLEAHVPMGILTNKPVKISLAIVEGLGLTRHFFRVYGGNSFEQKKPHPIGIQKLMAESGFDTGETIMVGDSSVDVETARNAGVRACGVTWGFQPDSLRAVPPDILVDRLDELVELVFAEALR